jgi:hypothetical protein
VTVQEAETEGSRLSRAATCDPALFAQVAGDARTTRGALLVVFGVALASGIGHLPAGGLSGLLGGGALWLLAWALWLLTVYLGALGMGHPSELARLFRSLGYASVPFALGALEWLPLLGALLWLAKWGLGFFAFTTATREALEVDTTAAAILCGLGAVPAALALHLL